MGISTTGFVLTQNKDVFEVAKIITKTLESIVKKYAKDVIFRDKTSSYPLAELRDKSITFYFRANNEYRVLSVHFGCDSDYSEYGDDKIIWSLNAWGINEEIVLALCHALKHLGKTYYRANDAETVEFDLIK